MDNDSIERIRQVFEELNRPSAARLKTALKQRDIAYGTKTVNEVVSKSTEKQLQLPVYNYKEGKITAAAPNSRWQIDTMDLTSKPSRKKGEKTPTSTSLHASMSLRGNLWPKLPEALRQLSSPRSLKNSQRNLASPNKWTATLAKSTTILVSKLFSDD